jgi:hypothetical protein
LLPLAVSLSSPSPKTDATPQAPSLPTSETAQPALQPPLDAAEQPASPHQGREEENAREQPMQPMAAEVLDSDRSQNHAHRMTSTATTGQEDPLANVLPPELAPPEGNCHPQLLANLERWQALTARGGSLVGELRRNKTYRNPELLQKMVNMYDIYQYGTTLPPDVFDPGALPESDRLEAIRQDWAEEEERRKKSRAAMAGSGTARIQFQKPTAAAGAAAGGGGGAALSAAVAAAQAKAAALAAGRR